MGNGTDAAPQFTCWFLLRGKLRSGRGVVETRYPDEEPIAGNISFEDAQVSLTLREDHGGCLMTTGSMVREPYRALLDRPGEGWLDVALVQMDRAALRPSAGAPAPRTPYLVEGDLVWRCWSGTEPGCGCCTAPGPAP
ncbi:hypothetical protein [Belnapia sp. F-4-1]|uniref:hypothetical protein n=1 Tax=Belnapia sp. F-4-1 TaxID=1545443 RepID=UPI00068EEFFA|nr:hypothetical protein [Belnapia sp. F-4-1]